MITSSHKFEMIKNTLASSQNRLSIQTLCAMAGVSRSGYYAWLQAEPKRREKEEKDRKDFELILSAYKEYGYSKGARGIYMALLRMDPPVQMNVKKIRRLMLKFNLSCPHRKPNPYKRISKFSQSNKVAENLLQREFRDYGPRVVLLTDITYLPYNGQFAYLSTVLDAYTREILSYAISTSLDLQFVVETIEKLIEKHGISLHDETIMHSDQGAHYTSKKFVELLSNANIRQSMSRRGNCWDNAPQESFFGHMKDHIREKLRQCKDHSEVTALVDAYIDYYNNRRYQWDLAKLAPSEFYQFITTGVYPVENVPQPKILPVFRDPLQLGSSSKIDPQKE